VSFNDLKRNKQSQSHAAKAVGIFLNAVKAVKDFF
jgi:hypothetical protein